jgi:hypothetical protein
VHGVLDMWRQAKHQNVLADSRLFHSVVKGLPAERLPELIDIFWYIKTQQQRPTPYVYARVIAALKEAKRDNEVRSRLSGMSAVLECHQSVWTL